MRRSVALLCAFAVSLTAATAGSYDPSDDAVAYSLYQTSGRAAFREISSTPFTHYAYGDAESLDLDAAEPQHAFEGLGVALTDAAAWTLARLEPAARRTLLRELFTEEGLSLSWVRLNVGASDYSTALYTYDETSGDEAMADFSLARDDRRLIPMAKEIQSVRPDVGFLSAMWSPPGWMKTGGTLMGGSVRPDCEAAFVNYLTAYVRALKDRRIDLRMTSVINEPTVGARGDYPGTLVGPEQEARLAKALRRSFDAAGIKTGVLICDDNYLYADRVARQLRDDELVAAIAGVAWHPYGGNAADLKTLHAAHPGLSFHLTEMGGSLAAANRTESWWCRLIFTALKNGCSTYSTWNLALDEDGKPTTGPFTCTGLVTVDSVTRAVTRSAQYAVFRHLGPFVRPGARVFSVPGANDTPGIETVAFRNPDGSVVVVAGCDAPLDKRRLRLGLKYRGQFMKLPLPVGTWSVTTLVFPEDKTKRSKR